MKRFVSCCLLALCFLLSGCAAAPAAEAPGQDKSAVLYWTGGEANDLLGELLTQRETQQDVLMSSFRNSISWQGQTVESRLSYEVQHLRK